MRAEKEKKRKEIEECVLYQPAGRQHMPVINTASQLSECVFSALLLRYVRDSTFENTDICDV